MKKPLLILGFGAALVVALIIGYIVGSIRAARLVSLNGQIESMTFAFAVADATRTGNSNIIYPDCRIILSSTYEKVTNDSWLRDKLLIPVVKWDTGDAFPKVSFGVSDAEQRFTAQAEKFLRETENQSNRLTTTNQTSPKLSP